MAKYLKIYCKYPSDVEVLKRRLQKSEDEFEIKIVEGEDNMDFEFIKEK